MIAVAGLIWLVASVWAQYPTQYPGQYPPNTYPPGTYPPGTYPGGGYPPNTYPPNTVPARLPGGIPVAVPVPTPKIPKKESKSGDNAKVTLSSVDGTLRKLAEKDLVLAARKTLLRFRLLAKTEFSDTKGGTVRESLMHPGDQLSVQVSPDDPETALRVVLVHSGTAAERAEAERPFDPDTVRAPRAEDLSKPRTVTAHGSAPEPAETSAADAEPASSAGNAAGDAASKDVAEPTEPARPAEVAPAAPDLRPQTDAAILGDARARSAEFSAGLPNYLVQQVTSRYFSSGFPAQWRELDVVTAELTYVNGTEDYRDFRINGEPIRRPIESTGTWSTGEFGSTLEDVMSPLTNASFHRRGEEKLAGRQAYVFDYTVAQATSHWTMVSPDGRRYSPAYEGAVWIDAATRRVLKVEQRTKGIPSDFPISRAEAVLEYGFAAIDRNTYLLPAKGESNGCMTGSGACTRNVIEFRNYRKFTADSTVTFGK
jgi:hypothetical protein